MNYPSLVFASAQVLAVLMSLVLSLNIPTIAQIGIGKYICLSIVTNFAMFFIWYGSVDFIMYKKWPTVFNKNKFNPRYPPQELVAKERVRCYIAVSVACLYDILMSAYCFNNFNTVSPDANADFSNGRVLLMGLALLLWTDAHFFFMHRSLHLIPWLYHNVHRIHHESYNPGVWSGMSFHPFESMTYFSSILICAVVPMPIFMAHGFRYLMILAPLGGHSGHGCDTGDARPDMALDSYNHYIHHAKHNYNYGSGILPFWDYVFGTGWPGSDKRTTKD